MELTKQEQHELLVASLKTVIPDAIEELKRGYWFISESILPNGDHVFEFASSGSPTLELRIKSGE